MKNELQCNSKTRGVISVRFSEEENRQMAAFAKFNGIGRATLIRMAVVQLLNAASDNYNPKESKNEQQIHSGPVCGQAGGTENEGRSGSVGRRDTL